MKKRKKMKQKKAAKKSYATPVFNKFQSRLRAARIGGGRGAGEAEADPPVSASFVLACCTCSIEMRSAFCPKDLCQIKEKKGR